MIAAAAPPSGCAVLKSAEVGVLFRHIFPERSDLHERAKVDLIEATRRQLMQAGLTEDRIALQGPCTVCGGKEFHSWRRDRQTGARMFSAIGRLA